MNRREVLATLAASAAIAPLAQSARADASISPEATSLYDRSIVFDANMFPPLSDKLPIPPDMLDMARKCGITAVKSSLGGIDETFEGAVDEISFLQRVIEAYPDVYMQVRNHSDFAEAKRSKRLGIVLSFEAVSMLEDKIDRIELFRGLGVLVMQLTYNKPSPFGTGVLGDPTGGLTPLGHKAVDSMNTLGVAIDLSHSNQTTSMDVLKATAKPAIITHTGCKAVYDHPRNKTDELLRAVAQKGGVIGIYDLPYLAASPKQPTLDDYMAHMTHALSICGEDHVGVGSDSSVVPFDTSAAGMAEFKKDEEHRQKAGVAAPGEDRPPYTIGLNSPRRSEIIADALLKRGYPARVAEKVIGLNFTNALGRIWLEN
jgi:membrane dipeptidase